ncbi:MAG: hypothetical protein ACJ8AW_28155 [Rhodopila sp.]|jgi:hypothetical protein
MKRRLPVLVAAMTLGASTTALSADPMRFWNLTGTKITKLYLAPAGTTQWGPDQCRNDPDGSVDPDERLKLAGIDAGGHYDVKLTDASGRTCVVRNVVLQAGGKYAFSVSEEDLKDCSK